MFKIPRVCALLLMLNKVYSLLLLIAVFRHYSDVVGQDLHGFFQLNGVWRVQNLGRLRLWHPAHNLPVL